MCPRSQRNTDQATFYESRGFYNTLIHQCHEFHEMTGEIGDVILLHPLMCHSASRNSLRIPRIITNPPVSLRENFNFNRDDPEQYSLVERKTLQELGRDRLDGWKIQGEREAVTPARLKAQAEMKKQELERLQSALATPNAA
jgi:ectoine hydroxylase-related dioxygenase (phytanoyl-CoA dioxygenase family)